jgi:negative regulator of sigma E activity
MNDEILSAFLDDELPPERVGALLVALQDDAPGSAELRDRLTVMQLIKDAVGGVEAPDDGFTLRILARLRAERAARP